MEKPASWSSVDIRSKRSRNEQHTRRWCIFFGTGHCLTRSPWFDSLANWPRADVLSRAARSFFADEDELYALALHVEKTAIELLEEYKPGRHLQTNVEFYTALLLRGLGLHPDLFTPMFATGRVAGWVAHCMEQRSVDRIFRPESRYTGTKSNRWTTVEDR